LTVVFILIASTFMLGWFRFTRVYTTSARVRAAVVALSPVVDARLLALNVKVGNHVTNGQLLGRLDDSELRAVLQAAQATAVIKDSDAEAARAEFRLTEASFKADIEAARAQAKTAAANVKFAEATMAARKSRLQDEVRAAKARYHGAQANLARIKKGPPRQEILSAQARLEAERATLALHEMEVEQSQQLVTKGIASEHLLQVEKTRRLRQDKIVSEAELLLEKLMADPSGEEIEAAEQALANLDAQLALARNGRSDVESLAAELEVRRAQRAEAEAQLAQVEARESSLDISRERIRAAEAELNKAKAEVSRAEAVLAKLEFVSPVDGIVTRTFDDIGEVCRKGVPSILIADVSRERWIEGFIEDEDAMLVHVGNVARVQVPAGIGRYVLGIVEQVGMHTESLDGGPPGASPRYPQPERVWVKIRTREPLPEDPITGTSAKVVIKIREMQNLERR
jgi:multidrug resistance efflux pump